MKKILLMVLLLASFGLFIGCTNQPTNTDDETTESSNSSPKSQDSILDSISAAIKNAFD